MKTLAILALLTLTGCATVDQYFGAPDGTIPGHTEAKFPEGEITYPPFGYIKHCVDYPDSIFCE